MKSLLSATVLAALAACAPPQPNHAGGGAPQSSPSPPAPSPPAPSGAAAPTPSGAAPADSSTVAALAPLPAAFTCDGGSGPAIKPLEAPSAPPPMGGQMTEQAAQAKRLFDSERWGDAVNALRLVASGNTGDDEGNRQIAEYHVGIALSRMNRDVEAAQSFRAIAAKPNHLKHHETLLWLTKIAGRHPEHLTLIDFATYGIDVVERFNNPSQAAVYASASYFVGRERLAEGKGSQARLLLEHVPPSHPYAPAAKKCLALAK